MLLRWGALLPFALCWFRARKPPGTGTCSPRKSCSVVRFYVARFSESPPRRCGREATGPPTPRSKRRGVVSELDPPKPRRRLIGRRSSGRNSDRSETTDFGGYATSAGRIAIYSDIREFRGGAFVISRRPPKLHPVEGGRGLFVVRPRLAPASASAESRETSRSRTGGEPGGRDCARYDRPGRSARIFSTMLRTPSLEISFGFCLLWRSNPSNWSNSDGA